MMNVKEAICFSVRTIKDKYSINTNAGNQNAQNNQNFRPKDFVITNERIIEYFVTNIVNYTKLDDDLEKIVFTEYHDNLVYELDENNPDPADRPVCTPFESLSNLVGTGNYTVSFYLNGGLLIGSKQLPYAFSTNILNNKVTLSSVI
uniref:Uncharacterized protein n=1 Tax=Cacopsylla melanoneura TaxID=428564 RepID=A0A8D9B595_9HEMI